MTNSIDYEAMRALAIRQRDALERVANAREPNPPASLETHAEKVAFRQGVSAYRLAVREAKKEG
jgi:hypothetical protein